MKLSNWALLSKRAAVPTASPEDRRHFVRLPCEVPVELHAEAPGLLEIFAAVARNISSGGMLLECSKAPDPRTLRYLSFSLPRESTFGGNAGRPMMVRARIKHRDPNNQTFGVEFASPLNDASPGDA